MTTFSTATEKHVTMITDTMLKNVKMMRIFHRMAAQDPFNFRRIDTSHPMLKVWESYNSVKVTTAGPWEYSTE